MITFTILTRNSARLLQNVLGAVQWASEVVVLDTGSDDQTLEIAASFPNVVTHQTPFTDFGTLHNQMAALASHDWIFSLDSDEVLDDDLSRELQRLTLEPTTVYSVSRCNYFNGKWIRGCGWYPDRVFRLYHRKNTRFSSDHVHERVLTEGLGQEALHHPLHHYSYAGVGDLLTKMQLYTDLFAAQHQGRRSSLPRALAAGWMAFIRSYLLKRGIRDGYEGFVISLYNAQTAYYKYLKLKPCNNLAMASRKGELTQALDPDPLVASERPQAISPK